MVTKYQLQKWIIGNLHFLSGIMLLIFLTFLSKSNVKYLFKLSISSDWSLYWWTLMNKNRHFFLSVFVFDKLFQDNSSTGQQIQNRLNHKTFPEKTKQERPFYLRTGVAEEGRQLHSWFLMDFMEITATSIKII